LLEEYKKNRNRNSWLEEYKKSRNRDSWLEEYRRTGTERVG
jgi:hypothetical protein